MEEFRTWLRNLRSAHHRMMMRYLRRRGWVVFYLDEQARTCGAGTCWLEVYQAEMRRKED